MLDSCLFASINFDGWLDGLVVGQTANLVPWYSRGGKRQGVEEGALSSPLDAWERG